MSLVPAGVGAELQSARRPEGGWEAGARIVSVVLAMLLAVTMLPAAGLSSAYADEPAKRPATSGGDVALESANGAPIADGTEFADGGLRYVARDGGAALVGFEDGAALEGALAVPETVTDGTGTATVKAVEVAEGQVADKVTALTLPQTVETVKTEGLAAAFPLLASIEVAAGAAAEGDGNGASVKGAYSSVAGMLFRSAEGQASSDGTAFADDALELVWAPPAMVVARVPLECKAIAAGAFVDAAALETVMSFGKMESIASAEKDDEGNVTKPGAFTDEQIAGLTIVVPGTNYAVTSESAERVSGSVALSEKTDMLEKRKAWFHHGFDTEQIIMGAPFGEIEGVNAVSDEGVMEDRSLVTPLENGKSHLELTPEEEAEKAARRGEDPDSGLSFSYQASMDLSVRWAGDRTATPAHIDVPAYAKVDGVTYQVTAIEPSAFEGAVFLSSVTIPEGVTSIGESAFAGCTNLREVSLPSTLKTIDYAAFKGTALEAIDIPESVRIIGGEAFAECANLQSANVSQSTYVSENAFDGELPSSVQSDANASPDADQPVLTTVNEGITPYASYGPAQGFDFSFQYDPSNFVLYDPPFADDDYDRTLAPVPSEKINQLPKGYEPYSGVYVPYARGVDTDSSASRTRPDTPDPGARFAYTNAYNRLHTWGNAASRGATRYIKGVLYHTASCTNGPASPDGSHSFYQYIVIPPDMRVFFDAWNRVLSDGDTVRVNSKSDFWSVSLKNFDVAFSGCDNEYIDANAAVTLNVEQMLSVDDPTRAGFRFLGWTGPGYDTPTKTSAISGKTAIEASDADASTLDFTAHWEPAATVRFVTGTGVNPDNITYYKGETKELPTNVLPRTGFFFAGWYPSHAGNDYWNSGYWASKQDGKTLVTKIEPAASGDVTFTAVWKPKLYTVKYNTDASRAADGTRVVDPPADKTFAHPNAADVLAGQTSLTYGIDENGNVVSDLNLADNAYFDLASVSRAMVTDYALGEPATKLGAYPFVGWCKNPNLEIGTIPKAENGDNRYWTVLREAGTNYFTEVFLDGWSEYGDPTKPMETNVYGVWGVTETGDIALAPTQPSYVNNLGEQVVTAADDSTGDRLGDATRGTESIRFRENLGFIGQAAASVDSEAEALHTGTPSRQEPGDIDAAMNLRAPIRYGFEFLGWGPAAAATTDVSDAADKVYISYDEDAAKQSGKTGFALTKAGAALVDRDAGAGTSAYNGPDSWAAYWETRTVNVTLRIPSHAVKDVDFTGESTKTGHPKNDLANHPYNTKADYTFTWTDDSGATQTWEYAWREGDAGETGNGATSGWYITDKRWGYYDVLEYPAFATHKDRYTYDGWYEMVKPSAADSTDKALEDLAAAGSPAMLTPVATYESLVQPNTRVRVTGLSEAEGGLTIPEGYFLTGQGKGSDGGYGRTLWLWASPIRINVASPVGVYLCTTNSYGQAVEPFVVGNDRRTQLEAQATFQVATNSHDLQLVGVTAEDVTSYAYKKDDAGNTVTTPEGIPVVDPDSVQAGLDSTETGGNVTDKQGIADKILNPKTPEGGTGNLRYSDEGSRMFWVSPVPTATADQTGVVYDNDAVNTRRYFGFGYKGADSSLEPDNRIEDDLPNSSSGGGSYELDGFVLRRHDNWDAGKQDGLVLESYDAASNTSTYRFYYGLDMRRAEFDLAGLQDIIDNNTEIDYNSAFDQPLLRVKFTFAAARNPGISYFSARGGDEAGAEKIPEETVITVGGAS